jgi:tetratricopeptide (TPR) repeat protein
VKAAFLNSRKSSEYWLAAIGACLFLFVDCSRSVKRSAYQIELDQIGKDIWTIEHNAADKTVAIDPPGKMAYLLFRRASLTGDSGDFRAAEKAIDRALAQSGLLEELCLLRANCDFKLHRFSQIKKDFEMAPNAAGRPLFEMLQGDLAFQEGRYDDARKSYEASVQNHKTWDSFARLAYYTFVFGDVAGADKLYVVAQDQITAREMGSYAWVELQRGFLRFSRGKYNEALEHYQRAEDAFSGSWLVEDYIAEALGAQGRFKEAEANYKKLVARSPRPEFYQALGDLFLFMGDAERAGQWHDKALVGYRKSVEEGNVHYFHHLAGFYADVRHDGPEAVRWARRDAELRDNFLTQDSLGWALYRDNQFAEALAAIDRALSSNVQDAQIFVHAALINLANGRTEEGKQLFQRAAQVNPSHGAFHVHR